MPKLVVDGSRRAEQPSNARPLVALTLEGGVLAMARWVHG